MPGSVAAQIASRLGYVPISEEQAAVKQVNTLQTQNSQLQSQISTLQAQISSLNKTIAQRNSTISGLDATDKSQLAQISTLRSQNASDLSQINSLKNTITSLQTQIYLNNRTISSLKSQLTTDTYKISELTSQVSALTAQLASETKLAAQYQASALHVIANPSASATSGYVPLVVHFLSGIPSTPLQVPSGTSYEYVPVSKAFSFPGGGGGGGGGSGGGSTTTPTVSAVWSFGDGGKFTGINPGWAYFNPGIFTPSVTITVVFNGNTYVKTFVLPPIRAALRIPSSINIGPAQAQGNCNNQYKISFTDRSGNPCAYSPYVAVGKDLIFPAGSFIGKTDINGNAYVTLHQCICGASGFTIYSILDPTVSNTASGQPPCF